MSCYVHLLYFLIFLDVYHLAAETYGQPKPLHSIRNRIPTPDGGAKFRRAALASPKRPKPGAGASVFLEQRRISPVLRDLPKHDMSGVGSCRESGREGDPHDSGPNDPHVISAG